MQFEMTSNAAVFKAVLRKHNTLHMTDSMKSIGQLIVHNLPHIELQLFQLKQIFQDTYS